jgi:hypothetical protein
MHRRVRPHRLALKERAALRCFTEKSASMRRRSWDSHAGYRGRLHVAIREWAPWQRKSPEDGGWPADL